MYVCNIGRVRALIPSSCRRMLPDPLGVGRNGRRHRKFHLSAAASTAPSETMTERNYVTELEFLSRALARGREVP